MKSMRSFKVMSLIVAGVCLLYVASFFVVFDVLGPPTRTMRLGWIGPAQRFNPQVIDIGGVYEYQGGGSMAYTLYQPLCSAWVEVNGLD